MKKSGLAAGFLGIEAILSLAILAACATPAKSLGGAPPDSGPTPAAAEAPAGAEWVPPPAPEKKVDMVAVAGGTFTMGSDTGAAPEKPVHKVTVASFMIGVFEITQTQYKSVLGKTPSSDLGPNQPVEAVSWEDAVDFCNALSLKEGFEPCYTSADGGSRWTCDYTKNGYRLPTEAEWEFAARGGTLSKGTKYPGSAKIDEVAWSVGNSGTEIWSSGSVADPASPHHHRVGTRKPNELGLYDMAGNVWEWCDDLFGPYSAAAAVDPRGPSSGMGHVMRGGSFDLFTAFDCYTVTARIGNEATGGNCGFRVARSASE